MENYIIVNSKYKQKYENSNNFTFKLSKQIEIKKYIKLIYCGIPETSFLINQYNCNFFILFSDSTVKSGSIPFGDYKTSTLCTAIQNAVNYDSFTCAFDTSLNKFTFSSGTKNFTIYGDVKNSVNYVFGLSNLINYSSASQILYCPNFVNFLDPSLLYISIDNLYNPRITTNLNLNISYVIPITAGKNNVNFFNENTYNSIIYCDNVRLNNLKISILTYDGNLYENNNKRKSV